NMGRQMFASHGSSPLLPFCDHPHLHRSRAYKGRIDHDSDREGVMKGTTSQRSVDFLMISIHIKVADIRQEPDLLCIFPSPFFKLVSSEGGLHGDVQTDEGEGHSRSEDHIRRLRIRMVVGLRMGGDISGYCDGTAHDHLLFQ